MKKAIKATILSFVAILLNSCYTQIPLTSGPPENNKTYKVEYLFEHDGCKVYRFYDYGHYVYFTNCTGQTTSVEQDSTGTRVVNMIRKQSVNKK